MLRVFFQAGIGSIVSAGANLITVPLLATSLGIEEYGRLSLLLTVLLTMQVLSNLQPWQAFIHYWSGCNRTVERIDIMKTTLFLELSSCFIGSIYFSIIYLSGFFENEFQSGLEFTLLLLALLCNPMSLTVALNRVRNRFIVVSHCEIIRSLIRLIGATFCFYFNDIIVYIWSFFISNLLASAYGYYSLKNDLYFILMLKDLRNNLLPSVSHSIFFKRCLRYSIYAMGKAVVDLPVQHLDKIVVHQILGNAGVGLLDIAKRICQGFAVIINVVNQVIFPYMVKRLSIVEFVEVKTQVMGYTRWSFLLISSLVVVVFLIVNNVFNEYFVAFEWLEFSLKYSSAFLIVSSFILIHVLFQAAGFIKKDLVFLMFANVLYLTGVYFILPYLGMDAIIIFYLIQALLVLSFKLFILNKSKKVIL
ncbi:MAG: oligosaccharide flippase family protein [Vibrionaceae bacterium]|nr:oligosaccharide flippase family protein [Vibrionaceae bacterium]